MQVLESVELTVSEDARHRRQRACVVRTAPSRMANCIR